MVLEKIFFNWPITNKNAYGGHGNFEQAKQFQRRRFLEIDLPETRIAYGSHVCKQIGTKWQSL